MTQEYPEKLDVVIPVLNEYSTVQDVVKTCLQCSQVNTVIVVIDPADRMGSETRVPYSRRTKILHSPVPGKGQCVDYGIKAVETPRVIFCDSDYTGLNQLHIDAVCRAYSGGQIIGVPDIPSNYPADRLWAWKWVSGLRSVPTEIATNLDLHGYLMETQLNKAVGMLCGRPTLHVRCRGLKSSYRMTERRKAARDSDRAWGQEHGVFK